MAHGRVGKGMMGPVMLVQLAIFVIILGFAGWSFDNYIDGHQHRHHLGGNAATSYMLIFSLLGATTGIASLIVGYAHYRAWKPETLPAAAASAAISWALMSLAFGLAWKEFRLGGYRGRYLQTLEVFIIVSTLIQLFYLMSLHAGHFNHKYGPGFGGPGSGPECSGEGPSHVVVQKASGNEAAAAVV